MILSSFALAFYILLSPNLSYSLDKRIVNDDPNNPWNLIPTYQVYENETTDVLNNNLFIIQKPDENTNMFTNIFTSFFATILLLTGDTSSFSNWSFVDNPELVILMVLFMFAMIIYIINVFITLYGEVNDDDILGVVYKMKAKAMSEIELFYMLPHQRRFQKWFPEVLYFDVELGEAQELIKELISEGKWNTNEFPEMKQDLLNKLKIQHN
ncbi:uncharacterized protein OCT59_012366 [Rhizophagus irregularis]|uniref:Ion transport domain-containing protein n=1 Tax=Rhizophagus irregularis (strain DAOM 197198w) TaxID=1432141 RepID=A0A015IXW2_RHIIW|nr:hypothetical protein RirG_191090 [Rhizophagus irregularis DAOM 197198w]UZO01264.1 hypothetical protein OCT59_012366 [Rhizophagus irregularis]GET64736.1 hypothetical protein GLOIN_2v171954 [Rhizophagus irregularis DAOM 181602=DAOM 197198]